MSRARLRRQTIRSEDRGQQSPRRSRPHQLLDMATRLISIRTPNNENEAFMDTSASLLIDVQADLGEFCEEAAREKTQPENAATIFRRRENVNGFSPELENPNGP